MTDRQARIFLAAYSVPWLGTLIFLVHGDLASVTWWNWPGLLGADVFIAAMWPLYWSVLHWLPRLFG